MAIFDNAVRTSQSAAKAALACSVYHPDFDTDCHVVEPVRQAQGTLLAMTIIRFGRVHERVLSPANKASGA